jgi:thiamine-phosphate pyrophosphorylase
MVICITNRKLCSNEFLQTVEKACVRSDMVILREKDLTENEYSDLACEVSKLCKEKRVLFCVHSFIETAKRVPCDALQLSYPSFCDFAAKKSQFCKTGVSIHSAHEAIEAQRLGANFLIAGHIFATSSKDGIPPRGLAFLREVVSKVHIPVYAIGGIQFSNAEPVYEAGAKGICMMSQMMRSVW